MNHYYRPSGKYSLSSFLFLLLSSLIVLPLLAAIYTYLIWYIPIVYINILVTLGFGFGVGFVLNYLVIGKGKVRNKTIAILFGLIGGLVALYFSWAIWLDLLTNIGESYGNERMGIVASSNSITGVLFVISNPSYLIESIKSINEIGTWGIRGTNVSGIALSVIWAIEALIIVGFPIFLLIFRSKKPFCEFNNEWFEEQELLPFSFVENSNTMIENLENSNPSVFDNIERVLNPDGESHSLYTLYSSEAGENYLSIENKKATTNKKGEVEFDDDEFIQFISINQDIKESLVSKIK